MLDVYLKELDTEQESPAGTTCAASYPYFDVYWSEPGRHAFMIQHSEQIIGFAFVRDRLSTGSSFHRISEFYIKPENRRLGLGRQAVIEIWRRFPGDWQFEVLSRNRAAVRFWTSCIAAADGASKLSEGNSSDGAGRLCFAVRVTVASTARQLEGA